MTSSFFMALGDDGSGLQLVYGGESQTGGGDAFQMVLVVDGGGGCGFWLEALKRGGGREVRGIMVMEEKWASSIVIRK